MSTLLTTLGILLYVVSAVVVVINAELHDIWERGFLTFFLTYVSAICPVVNTVCAVFAIRTDVFRDAAKSFWKEKIKSMLKGIKDTYKRR